MNGLALLGIVLILYAVMVFWITLKKPQGIWKMKKIQTFIKILGEKGTEVFFYIFGLAALVVGIWLLVK